MDMTVIYIDSLALLNFIINYLLLLATARIGGTGFRRWRLAAAALFGAGYAVAVWLPGMMFLSGLFWKALSCAVMALIAFGGFRFPRLMRLCLLFIAASFLLGGVVLALGLLAGSPSSGGIPYMPVDFKTLFLTAGLSYAVLTLAFKHMGRHGARETAEVLAVWGNRQIRVKALLDSGHTLTDPISGAEVLILDASAAPALLPPPAAALLDPSLLRDPAGVMELMGPLGLGTRFRLIPFRAVGVDCGFLLAFRPDQVTVRGKRRPGCLIGISPTPLAEGIDALVSTI
ncbi:MAG: sigma-E processing peptidase SpoIIGA [Oscillospiraceae bacterium]|jgi:stage II sporulation protein GA (sporulation sigma-E factor processing peptidase)|nr:sigma-E processing peptidase SpoIIGA [Oscillospiraceae bacterium]